MYGSIDAILLGMEFRCCLKRIDSSEINVYIALIICTPERAYIVMKSQDEEFTEITKTGV